MTGTRRYGYRFRLFVGMAVFRYRGAAVKVNQTAIGFLPAGGRCFACGSRHNRDWRGGALFQVPCHRLPVCF